MPSTFEDMSGEERQLRERLEAMSEELEREKGLRKAAEEKANKKATLTTLVASKDLWRGAVSGKEREDTLRAPSPAERAQLEKQAKQLTDRDVLEATVAASLNES